MIKHILSPKFKASIRELLTTCKRSKYLFRYISDCQGQAKQKVVYVVEDANWSIQWDGINITKRLREIGFEASLDTHPSFYSKRILSFGSANVFYNFMSKGLLKRNKVVLTYFHGDFGISDDMDEQLNFVLAHKDNLSALILANTTMRERFIQWGFDPSKVNLIPLGVNVERFAPEQDAPAARSQKRRKLGVPEDAFVIGSFQKDGSGWGEGLTPKLIKGPDIFLDVLAKLPNKENLFCLLSGPSRGYVKAGLDKLGIAYKHFYFDDPDDVADLYAVTDTYLVTSREEGGPKAVLEAMASGVPLVTTKVGMAVDIIQHEINGMMVEVNDVEGLVDAVTQLRTDSNLGRRLSHQASQDILAFDWDKVAEEYANLYNRIIGIKDARD